MEGNNFQPCSRIQNIGGQFSFKLNKMLLLSYLFLLLPLAAHPSLPLTHSQTVLLTAPVPHIDTPLRGGLHMAPNIMAFGPALDLGEAPFWDEELQLLFYVDIFKHTIHSYNPRTEELHVVEVETDNQPVSLIIKVKGGLNKFIISVKNSLAYIHWDGVSYRPLIPEYIMDLENKDNPTRLNDGKCDPSHRLWAGTMSINERNPVRDVGALYTLHKDRRVVKQLSNVSISNGLAWSHDRRKMYYIDSLKYRIDSFDYHDPSGSISNEKTVFSLNPDGTEGFPDGMTIDSEGMLWAAIFKGAKVLRIDPSTGEVKFVLNLPAYKTTSVCFGGPHLEDLYVTSAKEFVSDELMEKYPLTGKTFRVTGLGVRGTPSLQMDTLLR